MTIYDSIGGETAVATAVDNFYDRVLDDPELKPFFDGIDVQRLKRHQRAFIGAALGGPGGYNGRGMRKAHEGLGITTAHFERVVDHLTATLVGLGVPDDTVKTIGGTLAPLRADIAQEA